MISMKLDVVTSSGTTEVAITPKVQVEFERHYQCGIASAFNENMKVEHIYFLAWKAMCHAGKTSATFDAWLDDVLDVEMRDGETDPLAPAP